MIERFLNVNIQVNQMDFENVPRHVGIILDGNRRFSKKLMLKPWKGHEYGAKKIESLLN